MFSEFTRESWHTLDLIDEDMAHAAAGRQRGVRHGGRLARKAQPPGALLQVDH
jgi:hypothetical protein